MEARPSNDRMNSLPPLLSHIPDDVRGITYLDKSHRVLPWNVIPLSEEWLSV